MPNALCRLCLLLALVYLIAPAFVILSACAGQDDDTQYTDNLVPLHDVLAQAQHDYPGRMLGVELEREFIDGRYTWIYEVKDDDTTG